MRRVVVVSALVAIVAAVVILSWAARATPRVRDHIVTALNARFASQVGLESFEVDVFPRPRIGGSGLTLRHNGRTDVPPLISIGSFGSSAGFKGLFGTPIHLRNVSVEQLEIRIPAGGLRSNTTTTTPNETSFSSTLSRSGIVIDEIVSRRARLEIASGKPGRLPRIFDIDDVVMRGFGLAEGARFHATVINPIPRGRVDTTGTFGPWNAADPELTPIRGDYTFKDANLDVIKGIGGILSSTGTYRGNIERIEVEGTTDTPDFSIDLARQPVPLTTKFKAVVDGTNGDTLLERVESRLGQSMIIANGEVVRTKDVKGRRVALDVKIERARLEDLLTLAVKSATPPLVGQIDASTTFLLPAGSEEVLDRLQLDGRFNLAQARFTSIDVQKRINMLSRRGRGDEVSNGEGASVVSNLRGRFVMRSARLSFSELTFAVPGSVIQLTGSYDLRADTVDFVGNALFEASLAEMTSGYKSMLARLAQPFFRRPGGGSRLPIRISGPRTKPSFGLDMKRVLRRG